jgi:hypothetical protein
MFIKLTVKLAEWVEGIDLSNFAEGNVIELADADAALLIRGRWAEVVSEEERFSTQPVWRSSVAADRSSS